MNLGPFLKDELLNVLFLGWTMTEDCVGIKLLFENLENMVKLFGIKSLLDKDLKQTLN